MLVALSDSCSLNTAQLRKCALFFIPFTGLGLKDYWIVAQHNRLRSRVNPMAANMQKMVGGVCCLVPSCPLIAAIPESNAHSFLLSRQSSWQHVMVPHVSLTVAVRVMVAPGAAPVVGTFSHRN